MRGASITCPLCEGRIAFRRSELVNFVVNPSQKGGKTYSVRYCPRCIVQVRSKVRSGSEQQDKEIELAKKTQRELMHDMYGRTK